jgi:hypothetical protein
MLNSSLACCYLGLQPDDFWDMIESADGKALKLYVYSIVTDSSREVEITPNSKWGGDGL